MRPHPRQRLSPHPPAAGQDRQRLALLPADGGAAAQFDDTGSSVERGALERAFEVLSADDRAALVLHHLEGLPVQEIADRVGAPVGTMKARLYRARVALRRVLEEDVS